MPESPIPSARRWAWASSGALAWRGGPPLPAKSGRFPARAAAQPSPSPSPSQRLSVAVLAAAGRFWAETGADAAARIAAGTGDG